MYRMIRYSEWIWSAFGEPPVFGVMKFANALGREHQRDERRTTRGRRSRSRGVRRRRWAAEASGRKAAGFYLGRPRLDPRVTVVASATSGRAPPGRSSAHVHILAALARTEGHQSHRLGPRRDGRRRCPSCGGGSRSRRRVVLGAAALAPAALCVAVPRRRPRDAGVCVLNMWAYLAAYEMPHDDPERLEARVHVDYPIAIDRVARPRRAADAPTAAAFSTPGHDQPASSACSCGATGCGSSCPTRPSRYVLVARPGAVPERGGADVRACSTPAPCSTGRSRPRRRGGRPRRAARATARRSACGG